MWFNMLTFNFLKKIRLIYLYVIIFSVFSGCSKKRTILKRVEIKKTEISNTKHLNNFNNDINITIWIHGTRLLPKWIVSNYFETDPGLNKAESVDKKYYMRTIVDTISKSEPEKYPKESFYVFGWSGDLSFQQREKAARDLHDSLINLIDKYKKSELNPKITILCHSHGGNVALNMVKFIKSDDMIIENLILLACPVQKETKDFIKHKFFKKIYSFYSSMDVFQIIDPQGMQKTGRDQECNSNLPLFSGRTFENCEKLCQVKIKINGRGMLHSEFLSERFLIIIPQIINILDSGWQSGREQFLNNPEYLLSIKFKE